MHYVNFHYSFILVIHYTRKKARHSIIPEYHDLNLIPSQEYKLNKLRRQGILLLVEKKSAEKSNFDFCKF